LLANSRGVKILGSVSSLISIEKGYESAVAAALGSLADAIVVQDLSSAVSALTTMR
jgi:chromosome segregation protein